MEFQNLESPIQVKVESKNGEEKGEKNRKFKARIQAKLEVQEGGPTIIVHTSYGPTFIINGSNLISCN